MLDQAKKYVPEGYKLTGEFRVPDGDAYIDNMGQLSSGYTKGPRLILEPCNTAKSLGLEVGCTYHTYTSAKYACLYVVDQENGVWMYRHTKPEEGPVSEVKLTRLPDLGYEYHLSHDKEGNINAELNPDDWRPAPHNNKATEVDECNYIRFTKAQINMTLRTQWDAEAPGWYHGNVVVVSVNELDEFVDRVYEAGVKDAKASIRRELGLGLLGKSNYV
jgi:hypothetical protein